MSDDIDYWRDKVQKIEAALADVDRAREAEKAQAAAALAEARATAARALDETRAAANARTIRAELKARAIREGIRDPSDLALLDVSGIALDAAGDVVDGDKTIAAFKAAKPHLFGQAGTSSTAPPPASVPPAARQATDMTEKEYAAAKAAYLRKPAAR